MAIIKNKSTDENRQFWSHIEAVAKEVRTWPQWMGNRSDQAPSTPPKPQQDSESEEDEDR